MIVERGQETAVPEESTLRFIVAWAEERAAAWREGGAGQCALTPPVFASVARQAARLFGGRPLGELTFGELARLPALLEAGGMDPELARSASRDFGVALRRAIGRSSSRKARARCHSRRLEDAAMGERDENEAGMNEEREEGGGQRIPGRDFAGTSYASTEREQTADHRGETRRHRVDDAQAGDDEGRERSRDES